MLGKLSSLYSAPRSFLLLSLAVFFPALGWAQTAGARVENETMLSLPWEETENVWSYLKRTFNDGAELQGMQFRTIESVEQFTDTYFDTPQRTFLKSWAGVRYRQRLGEAGERKELIQIKLTPNLTKNPEDQNRAELKFKVREDLGNELQARSYRKLFDLVRETQLEDLVNELERAGVNPDHLVYLLEIKQERRRIYFRQGDRQFFTVTLDVTHSGKYWFETNFSQLELEIGENLFTNASEEERQKYLAAQRELHDRIKAQFPFLTQDQRPKIVKVWEALEAQGALQRFVLNYGETALPILVLLAMIAGAGAVAVVRWQRSGS